MDVWLVGSFLGHDDRDPVARGSRGILLAADREPDEPDPRRPSGPGAGPGRLGAPVLPAGEFVGSNAPPAVAPPRTETRRGAFADSRLAARMAEHEARQRATREAATSDEG